jgi:hypothetical protein
MNDISVKIPFDSTTARISAATKELAYEIYMACLGRRPTKNDAPRFRQTTNTDDESIHDQYFDGKKIGCLMTTYMLDLPRCITLGFKPVE